MSPILLFISNTMNITIPVLLDPFFETGTEGVVWAINRLGVPGYDCLRCLKNGDGLKVLNAGYNPLNVLWQGVVKLEYQRETKPYAFNPAYHKQEVGGVWVNGLQEDIDPDEWVNLFFTHRPAWYRSSTQDEWSALLEKMGITNLLPHQQVQAVLKHGPEKVKTELIASLPYSLFSKISVWDMSFKELGHTLCLKGEDLDVFCRADNSGYNYDFSMLSEEAVLRAMKFFCASDYIAFSYGLTRNTKQHLMLDQLKKMGYRDLDPFLEALSPNHNAT